MKLSSPGRLACCDKLGATGGFGKIALIITLAGCLYALYARLVPGAPAPIPPTERPITV